MSFFIRLYVFLYDSEIYVIMVDTPENLPGWVIWLIFIFAILTTLVKWVLPVIKP